MYATFFNALLSLKDSVRILNEWYIVLSDTPYFESTDKPDIEDISGSSVTLRWPKAKNISSGLETHYYYIVWLQGDGETQTSGSARLESRVTGLRFNTLYSVKVVPYRQHYELHESGTGTPAIWFKTCSNGRCALFYLM